MLFDLRARGRRRTVQVVYLGLALLFLLGFVGFGVGVGGGGGGIFNALTEGGGSNSASFAGRVAAAEKRTQRHPREAAAWAALAEAQLHEGSEPGDTTVVGETEQPTAKGKAVLAKVAHSWNTYIALEPHPSAELATKITGIFSEQSLNQPASEVRALQIAIKGNPASVRLYSLLAETAYKAGNLKVGDAAARKTVSLAPATERKRVKKLLAELRKNPFSRTPSTLTPGPNGTYIAKQGGKTFTVKSNGKGGYVGVPSTTGATGSKPTTGTTSTSPNTSSTSPNTSTTKKK
jgi:hypothetical protein